MGSAPSMAWAGTKISSFARGARARHEPLLGIWVFRYGPASNNMGSPAVRRRTYLQARCIFAPMLMNSARNPSAPDIANAASAPERNSGRGSPIEVTALRGRRDRNCFVNLPYRLHRDDPN